MTFVPLQAAMISYNKSADETPVDLLGQISRAVQDRCDYVFFDLQPGDLTHYKLGFYRDGPALLVSHHIECRAMYAFSYAEGWNPWTVAVVNELAYRLTPSQTHDPEWRYYDFSKARPVYQPQRQPEGSASQP